MVLLSMRLTKLDSTVVVRAVCVPSSGRARNGTKEGVRATVSNSELTLRPEPAQPLTGVDESLSFGNCADSGTISGPLTVPCGGLCSHIASALPRPGPGLPQSLFSFLVPLVWAGDAPCMPRRAAQRHTAHMHRHKGTHGMEWRQLVRNTSDTGNQCLSRDGYGGTTTTWYGAECVLRVTDPADGRGNIGQLMSKGHLDPRQVSMGTRS